MIERHALSNGITILLTQMPKQPLGLILSMHVMQELAVKSRDSHLAYVTTATLSHRMRHYDYR